MIMVALRVHHFGWDLDSSQSHVLAVDVARSGTTQLPSPLGLTNATKKAVAGVTSPKVNRNQVQRLLFSS